MLALTNDIEKRRSINGVLIVILSIVIMLTMLTMIPLYYIHKWWFNASVAPLFLVSIPVCGAPLVLNFINTTFQGENRISGLAIARLFPYLIYLPIGYIWYSNFGSSASTLMLLQNGCAIIVLSSLIIQLKPSFVGFRQSYNEINNENKKYGFHVYTGSVLAVSLGYVSGMTLGLFEDNNINVGFYTLAHTLSLPLSVLPTIVGTTHYKEFARQNRIKRSVIRNTVIVSVLSFVSFVIMVTPVVKWVYNETYSVVGYYSCMLAVGTVLHGFGDMFNRFLGAHGYGKEIRNSAIVTGIVQTFGSVILVYYWSIYGAIFTRIVASTVYFILMILYYRKVKTALYLK